MKRPYCTALCILLSVCLTGTWGEDLVVSVEPTLICSQPPLEIDPNLDPNITLRTFCAYHQTTASGQTPGQRRTWNMVLDRFGDLGAVPVTRLRWWGTYKGWRKDTLPTNQPMAWHISFWSSGSVTWDPYPFPEKLIHLLEIPTDRVPLQHVGQLELGTSFPQSCFQYDLALEPNEWFLSDPLPSEGKSCWLSITAVYPEGATSNNRWGWLTRPSPWFEPAKNTSPYDDGPSTERDLFPGLLSSLQNTRMGCDRAYNVAFELFTESPWILWNQSFKSLRHWPWTVGEMSQVLSTSDGRIPQREVADDWLLDTTEPITAISWYGSYLDYGLESCVCVPAPERRRPDYFQLSIYANAVSDDPVDHNHPGDKIWEVLAHDYDERWVGYARQANGDPNEAVFRYTVQLPESVALAHEYIGQRLWFSIAAGYYEPVDFLPTHWGWTRRSFDFGIGASWIDHRLRMMPEWRRLADQEWQPVDMAFTLYTIPTSSLSER